MFLFRLWAAAAIGISRLPVSTYPSDVLVNQAIRFLTGSYVLNHRPGTGSAKSMVAKVIDPLQPSFARPAAFRHNESLH